MLPLFSNGYYCAVLKLTRWFLNKLIILRYIRQALLYFHYLKNNCTIFETPFFREVKMKNTYKLEADEELRIEETCQW